MLERVLLKDGFASLSLDEALEKVNLSALDRRLCTALVYTTLENLLGIDFALRRFLSEPESLEQRPMNILRLGAAQLLYMDRIPDRAAVDESVRLARETGLSEYTGLVNAVLRNLIRGREQIPWPGAEDPAGSLSLRWSMPRWLVEELLNAYGEESTAALLSRRRSEHWIPIRPNLTRVDRERFLSILAGKVWRVEEGLVPGAWRVFGALDISRDRDFQDGAFSIQGEGSMLAAEAVSPGLGMQVLDCCAAPGGKTAYLAERMQGTGRVFAWDVHPHRVELLKAAMDRLRLYNVRPAVRDALKYREDLQQTMDAVLIDAPCSGLGVMDEKPDLKYRLTPESLASLKELQAELLETNSRYVRPGGVLVYATCSVLPGENVRQVEAFLGRHPEFQAEALPGTIPERFRQWETPLGLQLLPYRDGIEGFYLCRMRRQ